MWNVAFSFVMNSLCEHCFLPLYSTIIFRFSTGGRESVKKKTVHEIVLLFRKQMQFVHREKFTRTSINCLKRKQNFELRLVSLVLFIDVSPFP